MPFQKRPLELYAYAVEQTLTREQWQDILSREYCPYLGAKCNKIRKSQPEISIGTCTVGYMEQPVIICPHRFRQRQQIFLDTLHLLKKHQPGNQLHVVPEVSLPGGSVDYFVVSTHRGEIQDYLALEVQTLDSTGTVWPSRQQVIQQLMQDHSLDANQPGKKSYGLNWKMTAKTILVQMHHKAQTLELLNRKIVLVIQDVFFDYIRREFTTTALREAEPNDSVQWHIYSMFQQNDGILSLELTARHSTNSVGMESILGLRQDALIPENDLLARIQLKLSDATLLQLS